MLDIIVDELKKSGFREQAGFDGIRTSLQRSSYLAGVEHNQLVGWTLRGNLFGGMRPGKGSEWLLSPADTFTIAAIRLVHDFNDMTYGLAIKVLETQARVYGAYLRREMVYLSKNADGDWRPGINGPVYLTIDPSAVWDSMRDRWMELYPAETAQFEDDLEKLWKRLDEEGPPAD